MHVRLVPQLLVLLLLALMVGCSGGDPEKTSKSATEGRSPRFEAPPVAFDPSNPEAALREFMAAMAARDSERLQQVIVPHADAAILWEGEPPPPDTVSMMVHSIRSMPLTRLRLGERARVPSGGTEILGASRINEDRAEFLTPFDEQPVVVIRADGIWRVDASRLIAARKGSSVTSGAPADDAFPVEAPKP